MEPWTAAWWVVAIFVGVSLIINVLWRLGERLLGVNRPSRECAEWIEQVRRVLVGLIEVEIDKHTLHSRLVTLLGSQPPNYDGLAQEAFARTLLLSPALAAKAEQVGLFEPGTFARIGVPTYQSYNPVPNQWPQPPSSNIETLQRPFASHQLEPPETIFVGTVQVPKAKRTNGHAN